MIDHAINEQRGEAFAFFAWHRAVWKGPCTCSHNKTFICYRFWRLNR